MAGAIEYTPNDRIWSCPTCTFVNPVLNHPICQICFSEVDQKLLLWKCETCTLENKASNLRCDACGQNKSLPNNPQSTINSSILVNTNPLSSATTFMSLAVRERRHKDESDAEQVFQNIVAFCRKANIHFVDDQFTPSPRSLGPNSHDHITQWLRISEISPLSQEDMKLQWTVLSSPQPSDIQQGQLGDCWLMASLALIAERPRMLEHILLTKQVNREGVYLVRICHNGIWKTVLIDDCFPCTQYKQLAFTQAHRRQLYVPLIEKACAKLFGSYANLYGGQTAEGLQLLTGAACENINLTKHDIEDDIIWAKLLSACESNLLIGTSTSTELSEDDYACIRINRNHAFSILSVYALPNGSLRFVCVRDPHACSTYIDEFITPEILTQLRTINPARRSSGAFWISWSIFLRYFRSLTISSYVSDHFDVREQAKFTRSSTEPIPTFYFNVPETSLINVSLLYHRSDRRSPCYHTQSFVLCNIEQEGSANVGSSLAILRSRRGAFTNWMGSLRPGAYALIPFSTSFWQDDNASQIRDFTIVIHSSVQIDVNVINEPPTLLADCLIAIALRKGERAQQNTNSTIYVTINHEPMLFVAENLSTTHHLNIDIDMSDAQRIHHSRHSFITHDCIPPRHRQLISLVQWAHLVGESARMTYTFSTTQVTETNESVPEIWSTINDIHTPRSF